MASARFAPAGFATADASPQQAHASRSELTRPGYEYVQIGQVPIGHTNDIAPPAEPLAVDPQLGAIFRQIRTIIGVSELELARRVATDMSVIMDLEDGAIHALPPFPELQRIAENLGYLAAVDVSPLIQRLARLQAVTPPVSAVVGIDISPPMPARPQRTSAAIQATAQLPQLAPPMPSAPQSQAPSRPRAERQAADTPQSNAPRASEDPSFADEPEVVPRFIQTRPPGQSRHADTTKTSRQRRARWSVRFAVLVTVMVLALGLASAWFAGPRPVYAVASLLPAPIDAAMRRLGDRLAASGAVRKDGLLWIDVSDPRSRRGDRLDP